MRTADNSKGSVTQLVPLADKLKLVRCCGCGTEFEDWEATLHQDGYSEKGCPNQCGRLTDQVYVLDERTDKWVRT